MQELAVSSNFKRKFRGWINLSHGAGERRPAPLRSASKKHSNLYLRDKGRIVTEPKTNLAAACFLHKALKDTFSPRSNVHDPIPPGFHFLNAANVRLEPQEKTGEKVFIYIFCRC